MKVFFANTAMSFATALLLAAPVAAQSGSGITVTVNRQPVSFPAQGPIQSAGRVLVPLRGVLEKLGAFVTYDAGRQEVKAVRNDTQIRLPIGSRTAQVGGRSVSLDAPARVLNGSTLVPLRFVAEALGASVDYHAATSTVAIRTGDDNERTHSSPPVAANLRRIVRGNVIAVRPRQGRLVIVERAGGQRTIDLADSCEVRRRTPDADVVTSLTHILPGDRVELELQNGAARTITILAENAANDR